MTVGKIIQFTQKSKEPDESNFFRDMKVLITMACDLDVLNYDEDMIAIGEAKGYLLEGEKEKLVEQVREKRLQLAKPEMVPAPVAEEPGVYMYTPEMGQEKPDCQIEARRGYYGGHVYVDTPLELKGRGIRFIKKYAKENLTETGQYKDGWNEYCVTNLAFEKLRKSYTISMESLLD